MANYEGIARSNYLRVRDSDGFISWANGLGLTVRKNEDGHVALFSEGGGWPNFRWLGEELEEEEVDFLKELADNLQEGEVAVLMEVGHENMRYLTGQAIAVNHLAETISVDLGDIYEKAEKAFGIRPSLAEY